MDRFPTTRHSLILAVRSPEFRDEAVAAIVEVYWKPVYKYVRLKWNYKEDDARDATQDFFAGLLERDLLLRWEPARASFRTYLRLCIDGQIKNRFTAESRLKRSARLESLDFEAAERELAFADRSEAPEEVFHREWQRRLFELAIEDLRQETKGTPREVRFRVFERHDLAEAPPDYAALAGEFELPVTTVTNHLAWARRELRRLVMDRLAGTTSGEEELQREARDLFR